MKTGKKLITQKYCDLLFYRDLCTFSANLLGGKIFDILQVCVQTPQNILNFPQKDWRRKWKLVKTKFEPFVELTLIFHPNHVQPLLKIEIENFFRFMWIPKIRGENLKTCWTCVANSPHHCTDTSTSVTIKFVKNANLPNERGGALAGEAPKQVEYY